MKVLAYRPSNGSEGADFDDEWCGHCARDQSFRDDPDSGEGCPIVAKAFALAIDHPDYPKEWITDDQRGPRCTAFTTNASLPIRCEATPDLFAHPLRSVEVG